MISALAREFVLLFEALAYVLGRSAALLDSRVQAARLRWALARARCA